MRSCNISDDPLRELDHLVGLASVKHELKQILGEHVAIEPGVGGRRPQNPHLLLIGRAGVGKGTIAHSLGEIFRERGLLRSGHLVYADASLNAGYIGHTATRTLEKCKEALTEFCTSTTPTG
jgi:Holliday junction resolvasome RuvABC ATP-dependent DNA helicase subunit